MKKYIKNNTLVNIPTTIKVCNSYPGSSNLEADELYIIKNEALYKYAGGGVSNPLFYTRSKTERKVGTIIPFYGNTIPNGYLECDGGTFSQSDFPALYNLLGSTTLPDFRECVLRGSTIVGTFSDDSIIDHTHSITNGSHSHNVGGGNHFHCSRCSKDCTICRRVCVCSTGYYMAGKTNTSMETNSALTGSKGCIKVGTATSGITITGANGYNVDDTITRDAAVGVRFLIYTGVN